MNINAISNKVNGWLNSKVREERLLIQYPIFKIFFYINSPLLFDRGELKVF